MRWWLLFPDYVIGQRFAQSTTRCRSFVWREAPSAFGSSSTYLFFVASPTPMSEDSVCPGRGSQQALAGTRAVHDFVLILWNHVSPDNDAAFDKPSGVAMYYSILRGHLHTDVHFA
jgi:hypothetical protein